VDTSDRCRFLQFRQLGWLGIVLSLLSALDWARATDAPEFDTAVSVCSESSPASNHASARALPAGRFRHSPIRLFHVRRHAPSAWLTAARTPVRSSGEASEGNWKDDAALGSLSVRFGGSPTSCSTLLLTVTGVIAAGCVPQSNPRAPPSIA